MGLYNPNTMDFELGEILKLYRERAKMTQAQVAKILDVTPATIANYEASRTPLTYKKLLKFRDIFGEEFDYAIKVISEEDGKFTGRIFFRDYTSEGKPVGCFDRLNKVRKYLEELDSDK